MPGGEFRFVYYAQDYGATVAFYRDGLELPIVGGWDRGPEDQGTLFGAASGIIGVLHLDGRAFVPPQGGWLLYEVDDVAEQFQRARAKGLPLSEELADHPWGHRAFSVTDPNGLKVVLFSIIG